MNHTYDDIKLMDDFLPLIVKYKSMSGMVDLISEDLKLTNKYTQYIIDEICNNVPLENKFLVYQKASSGMCCIVSVDQIRLDKFIAYGGFKKYLDDMNKADKISGHNINIVGHIINGDIHQSDLRLDNNINKKQTIQPNENPNKKIDIGEWITKYWWGLVIPIIVVIIGLYIENKYFTKS